MTNLQKRVLTSVIILPFSIFFVIKGGYILSLFLIFILFAGIYELISSFKKKITILFLTSILTFSLLCIYYLSENAEFLLYFAIAVTVSSDIGGYAFGRAFKWKKLTKISPKKTLSGVIGAYLFSIITLFIWFEFVTPGSQINFKALLMTFVFSTIAQVGDLIISYFKRLEKIKDTGKILPGHGGIFDRIDGLMFVLIMASIYYYFVK